MANRFELTDEMREQFVSNILDVFQRATSDEIDSGINWYLEALTVCREMAANYDTQLETVVGVVAALSPNNRWSRNLVDAENIIAAYLSGDAIESVSVCAYHTMRAKAWSIMEAGRYNDLGADDIVKLLRGQKIVCFFQNILGINTCTIDGHARNIAYGERLSLSGAKFTIGKAEYQALQLCYAEAAEKLLGDNRVPGMLHAYEVQAITWVAWRRIHNI
jgi:hypothetical protein